MMKFLEKSYNMATEELSLLATYRADIEKKGKADRATPSKSFAANVKKQSDSEDGGGTSEKVEDSPKEKARKRSVEFCGKCTLCSKNHTWLRKDGEQWV